MSEQYFVEDEATENSSTISAEGPEEAARDFVYEYFDGDMRLSVTAPDGTVYHFVIWPRIVPYEDAAE